MPNIKSAKKRLRQSVKRALRNRAGKTKVKSSLKSALSAIQSKDRDAASKTVRQTSSTLDSAAAKRLIHKNAARRQKSRLMKKLNKI